MEATVERATTSVANSLLGSAVYQTPPDITMMAANAMGSSLAGAATDRMADQAPDENEIAETNKEIAETEEVTHEKLPDAKLPIVADPHRVDYANDARLDGC